MRESNLRPVKNLILLLKKFKSLSIRKKLVLFLITSIAAILSIYAGMSYIAKRTMLNNSRDSIINLSAQLMENLDQNVKNIESSSYQIKELLENRRLYNFSDKTDRYTYKEYNQAFQDIIIASNNLYPNVESAVFESTENICFFYDKEGRIENLEGEIPKELKAEVSKSRPYKWTRYKGKEVFLRLLVNNGSFSERGYLLFYMQPDFFDFIKMENQVLVNENLIVLDRLNQIQNSSNFNMDDPDIKSLIELPDTGSSFTDTVYYDNREYLFFKTDSRGSGWKVLILVPMEALLKQQEMFMTISIVIVCIILCFLILIAYFIIKSMTQNIQILKNGMEQFEQDGKALRMKPYNYDEIGKLIGRFNYMTVHIQELNEYVLVERKRKEKAEFQAIQAKINPHFLYNTLGSIKWIARREKTKHIENMLDALIYLMRFSIKRTDTFLRVEEEIEYIKSYLELQKMRFGDAFTVEITVKEEVKTAKTLGFLLQPIVENTLYHGIDMERQDGIIQISVDKEEEWLCIRVSDNGKGMTEEEIKRVFIEEKEYSGFNSIGIQIIVTRLESFYREKYIFQINSEVHKGTQVVIKIPFERCEYVSGVDSR